MRIASAVCFLVAGLALLAHAAQIGEAGLGLLAVAVSIVAGLVSRRSPFMAFASLAAVAAVAAFAAAADGGVILPAVAIVAALHGWDMSLAAPRLVGFSRKEQRPILLRYSLSSIGIATAGVALTALAAVVRVRYSFGLALGLSGAFLILAATVGVSARPRRQGGPRETPDDTAQ